MKIDFKNLIERTKKSLPYIVYTIIIFIFFLYITFPIDKLKGKLINYVSQNTGYKLDLFSMNTHYLTGVSMNDFSISDSSGKLFLNGSTMSIWVNPIPLIWGSTNLSVNAKTLNGKVSSSFSKNEKNIFLNLDFKNIELDKFGYLTNRDFVFAGKVNIKTKLDLILDNYKKANGDVDINSVGFAVKKLAIQTPMGPFNLPPLTFKSIKSSINIKNGILVLNNFELNGTDLNGKITGKINLANRLLNSSLDLKVTLKISQSLEEKFGLILSQFFAKNPRDNSYNCKFTGSLGNPMPMPVM
jgi:type II secretion system protein N